jgi:exosortase/archaeosortase family protein
LAKKQKRADSRPVQAEPTSHNEAGASNRPGSPLLRTSLLFVAFMGIFHAVLWLVIPEWNDNFQAQDLITNIVSSILNKLGVSSIAHGNQIVLTSNFLIVTQECTAVNVIILFTSFVLAYSSPLKAQLMGLIVGIPFISVVNIARIVATGMISEYFPKRYMELFHDYIWQTAFLFLVVTMWFVWIEMLVNREKTTAVPR